MRGSAKKDQQGNNVNWCCLLLFKNFGKSHYTFVLKNIRAECSLLEKEEEGGCMHFLPRIWVSVSQHSLPPLLFFTIKCRAVGFSRWTCSMLAYWLNGVTETSSPPSTFSFSCVHREHVVPQCQDVCCAFSDVIILPYFFTFQSCAWTFITGCAKCLPMTNR